MRFSPIKTTVFVLLKYLLRRVFSVGILGNKNIRIGLMSLGVVALGVLTAGNYLFFSRVGIDRSTLLVVYKLGATNAVFFSLVFFLFIKIVFWRTEGMVSFTWQLPLSHRERTMSLLFFEGILTLAGVACAFTPLALALILIFGISALGQVVIGFAFPALTTFLILSNFVNFQYHCFSHRKLQPLISIFLPTSLVGLMFGFNAIVPKLVYEISDDALNSTNSFNVIDFYTYVSERFTPWLAVASFLAICFLLILFMIVSVPKSYPKITRNGNLPIPSVTGNSGPHLAALMRRMDSWLLVIAAYAFTLGLILQDNNWFAFTILIPSTQGIYCYSATRSIRLLPGYRSTARSELWRIIKAQILSVVIFTWPIIMWYVIQPPRLNEVLILISGLLGSITVVTLLGILFPPDRENPFSILTSLTICLTFFVVLGAVLAFLSLPFIANMAIIVILQLFALCLTVIAIESLRKKERHA